jgi:hypothetical protein
MPFRSRIISHLYVCLCKLCLMLPVSLFLPPRFTKPQSSPLNSWHVSNMSLQPSRTKSENGKQKVAYYNSKPPPPSNRFNHRQYMQYSRIRIGGAVHHTRGLCRCWQPLHYYILLPFQDTKFETAVGLGQI